MLVVFLVILIHIRVKEKEIKETPSSPEVISRVEYDRRLQSKLIIVRSEKKFPATNGLFYP